MTTKRLNEHEQEEMAELTEKLLFFMGEITKDCSLSKVIGDTNCAINVLIGTTAYLCAASKDNIDFSNYIVEIFNYHYQRGIKIRDINK